MSAACNYPHLWPAQGRLDLRLRAMLESGKITRSGGTSKGSAQKDTLLREASKALIRQGKMWVIARPGPPRDGVQQGPGLARRDVLLATTAPLLWGGAFVAAKPALPQFPPALMT